MTPPADDNSPVRPEDTAPTDQPADGKKRDIRVSSHRDLGVDVTRDLTEQGRLARGDRSYMSRLSFSARAKPRDELDPELQALRDPAPPEAVVPPTPPAAPAPATPATDQAGSKTGGGLLGRIARLFGGE
jgi:hypothetical protein